LDKIVKSIRALAVCKKDCDFSALIASGYTNDAQALIKNVAGSLPPDVANTCGQTLSQYLNTGPVTADSILSSLGNKN
jgi:hypothetical protein